MICKVGAQNQFTYTLLRSRLSHVNLVDLLLLSFSIIRVAMFDLHCLVMTSSPIGVVAIAKLLLSRSKLILLTNKLLLKISSILSTIVVILIRLLSCLQPDRARHATHHTRIVLHLHLLLLLILVLLILNFILLRLLKHGFLLCNKFFLTFTFLSRSNIIFVVRLEPLQTLLVSTRVDSLKHNVFLLVERQFAELGFRFLEDWS